MTDSRVSLSYNSNRHTLSHPKLRKGQASTTQELMLLGTSNNLCSEFRNYFHEMLQVKLSVRRSAVPNDHCFVLPNLVL